MPLVAGICIIVAGATKILTAIGLAAGLAYLRVQPHLHFGANESTILLTGMIPLIILGVVSIAGGIFAIRRQVWGMALTGAIAAFLPSGILGILAIIFVAMSRNEFE